MSHSTTVAGALDNGVRVQIRLVGTTVGSGPDGHHCARRESECEVQEIQGSEDHWPGQWFPEVGEDPVHGVRGDGVGGSEHAVVHTGDVVFLCVDQGRD